MHRELEQDRICVTEDLIILTATGAKLQLFPARRDNPPFNGLWALPGCFVEQHESAEAAAHPLLEEMLPLPGVYLE